MKTLTLILLMALVAACQSEVVGDSTPNCDKELGEGWGSGYGTEVESQSNLDSDRCAQLGTVWCCAL